MIWTLVLFLFTMWVLSKVAFPKIQEALDKRAKTIAESIEAAERQRKESDELLEEYRAAARRGPRAGRRHHGPRPQGGRDRRSRGDRRRQGETRGAGRRRPSATSRPRRGARWSRSARRSPTSPCSRPRRSPASRSPPTTSAAWSRRRSARSTSPASRESEKQLAMAEAARVYAEALFDVGQGEGQARRDRRAARRVRRRPRRRPRAAGLLLQPLLLLGGEDRGAEAGDRRRRPELVNFLELLIEKHRMPEIFRIRRAVRASSGSRRTSAST